jgi:hypothetical protein
MGSQNLHRHRALVQHFFAADPNFTNRIRCHRVNQLAPIAFFQNEGSPHTRLVLSTPLDRKQHSPFDPQPKIPSLACTLRKSLD